MNLTRKTILILIIVVPLHNVFGQDRVAQYPVRFIQPVNVYTLENPATICSNNDLEVSMGNQRMLGNLSKISSYYASGNFRIIHNNLKIKPFSAFGISLYNDQEGKYINRSRIYAVYAWHATIFGNAKISGGLKIGGINYAVKGTPLSGNGSDIKPDASAGLQLYSKRKFLSVAASQLMNSKLQPFQEITQLNPYITLSTGGNFKPSSLIILQPIGSIFIPVNSAYSFNTRVLCNAHLRAKYNNQFDMGVGLHNSQRMVAEIGLPIVKQTSKTIELHISYTFLNFRQTGLNAPIFEIGLAYSKPAG